jgi:hypothetical protein
MREELGLKIAGMAVMLVRTWNICLVSQSIIAGNSFD